MSQLKAKLPGQKQNDSDFIIKAVVEGWIYAR